MNFTLTAKTLLTAQRYHKRMIGALTEMINDKAKNSFNSRIDTMNIYDRIFELMEKKKNLMFLYCLTNEILSEIDEISAQILIRIFMDDVSKENVAEEFNYSERSIYRKIQEALNEFCLCIDARGYREKVEEIILNTEYLYKTHKILGEMNCSRKALNKKIGWS